MQNGAHKMLSENKRNKDIIKSVCSNGSVGGHWSLMQTNTYADNIGVRFEHITPKEWNVTMNMMYSDYCRVANKYGSGMSDFYAYMAKAFLFDKDAPSPKEKLAAYYHSIAEK